MYEPECEPHPLACIHYSSLKTKGGRAPLVFKLGGQLPPPPQPPWFLRQCHITGNSYMHFERYSSNAFSHGSPDLLAQITIN